MNVKRKLFNSGQRHGLVVWRQGIKHVRFLQQVSMSQILVV